MCVVGYLEIRMDDAVHHAGPLVCREKSLVSFLWTATKYIAWLVEAKWNRQRNTGTVI